MGLQVLNVQRKRLFFSIRNAAVDTCRQVYCWLERYSGACTLGRPSIGNYWLYRSCNAFGQFRKLRLQLTSVACWSHPSWLLASMAFQRKYTSSRKLLTVVLHLLHSEVILDTLTKPFVSSWDKSRRLASANCYPEVPVLYQATLVRHKCVI